MPRAIRSALRETPAASSRRRIYEHFWGMLMVCGLLGFISYSFVFGWLVTYCIVAWSAIAQPIFFVLLGPPFTTTTVLNATNANQSIQSCNMTVDLLHTDSPCETFGIVLATPTLTGLLVVLRFGTATGTIVGTVCALGGMLQLAVKGRYRAYWPGYAVAFFSHATAFAIIQFLGKPSLYFAQVVTFTKLGAAMSLLASTASNGMLALFGFAFTRGLRCGRVATDSSSSTSDVPVTRNAAGGRGGTSSTSRLDNEFSQAMLAADPMPLIVIPRLDGQRRTPQPQIDKESLRDGLGVKRVLPQSDLVQSLHQNNCCVCLEAFDLRLQSPIAIDTHARLKVPAETPCGHHLHLGCLIDMYANSPKGPTQPIACPLCRSETLLETCRRLEVVDWQCDNTL